jgi:hypothetical protein
MLVGDEFSDQTLSISYLAILKRTSKETILICNFMSQPSELKEGFVVIRSISGTVRASALPLTTFGKVKVMDEGASLLELWSADSRKVGTANQRTTYTKRICRWTTTGYVCGQDLSVGGLYAPNSIIYPGIDMSGVTHDRPRKTGGHGRIG